VEHRMGTRRMTVGSVVDGDSGDWLTPQQVADLVQVSVDAIYDACTKFQAGDKRGLRHRRLGRRTIRVHRRWVNDWMQLEAADAA